MVANLKPAYRSSHRNLSLGALFGGFGKPDWFQMIKLLECQPRRLRNGTTFDVEVEKVLVSVSIL